MPSCQKIAIFSPVYFVAPLNLARKLFSQNLSINQHKYFSLKNFTCKCLFLTISLAVLKAEMRGEIYPFKRTLYSSRFECNFISVSSVFVIEINFIVQILRSYKIIRELSITRFRPRSLNLDKHSFSCSCALSINQDNGHQLSSYSYKYLLLYNHV